MKKTITNLTATIGTMETEVDDKNNELLSIKEKIKEEEYSLQQRRKHFENEVVEKASELVADKILENDIKTKNNIEQNNMFARLLQGNLKREYSREKRYIRERI